MAELLRGCCRHGMCRAIGRMRTINVIEFASATDCARTTKADGPLRIR
jgi:hypothetical protein